MSNIKDLTGSKIGALLLLERKREKNHTYYLCKCDCGNEKWIRSDLLTKEGVSCGCKRGYNFRDLTNKRFGMLTAIKVVGTTKNNGYLWECKCDCGNYKDVPLSGLISGKIVSCGCYQKSKAKENAKKAIQKFKDKNLIENTNISYLNRDKPIKSNKSGVTGVSFNNRDGLWIAYITFKKQRYYLGSFKNKEDAIKVRKEAEEKYFKEFLENLNKNS